MPASRVLLASSRSWFASALAAVLEPHGFQFTDVRSGAAAIDAVRRTDPSVIIVDEGLPDISAAELCRALIKGPAEASVPILVYSPSFWHEREQAAAIAAGAWDVLGEPVRAHLLVARLKRLVHIGDLIRSAQRPARVVSPGELGLDELVRTLPIVGSIAARAEAPLSCAVIGPTRVAAVGSDLERQRRATMRLCDEHTRLSDLRGWIGEAEMAIITYAADVMSTSRIVDRLSIAAGAFDAGGAPRLSAGIVDLPTAWLPGGGGIPQRDAGRVGTGKVSLARFASAQSALRRVRLEGGGVRIAEVM